MWAAPATSNGGEYVSAAHVGEGTCVCRVIKLVCRYKRVGVSSASVYFECRKPHVNYGEAMKLRIPSLVPYECLLKACKATLFLYNLNFHIKGSSSTK